MKKLTNIIIRFFCKEKSLVKEMWYDANEGSFYMHCNCRSAIFYLPMFNGEKNSVWLASIIKTRERKLPKTETIYQLMEINNNPAPSHE